MAAARRWVLRKRMGLGRRLRRRVVGVSAAGLCNQHSAGTAP